MDELVRGRLLGMHGALVAYHNTRVAIRFTLASLYVAAFALLVAAVATGWRYATAVAILGAILAVVCILIEIRTIHLLRETVNRGMLIEDRLRVRDIGFFDLVNAQQDAPPYNMPAWLVRDRRLLLSFYALTFVFWVASPWLLPGLAREGTRVRTSTTSTAVATPSPIATPSPAPFFTD